MKLTSLIPWALLAASFHPVLAHAQNCSNLPTQFDGDEFPTGDFFSNFNNSCYTIPLAQGNGNAFFGDLNSTYYVLFFKVNPSYQLIIEGSFPNARYFSMTLYDEHNAYSQSIDDVNIAPLSSHYINPYQPGVPYVSGQAYAVPVNLGGAPGTLQTGCMTNSYNVDINAQDGTLRHTGMDWNSDAGLFQMKPYFDLHVVDTPQHTNPNTAGYIMIRGYLDLAPGGGGPSPRVIVRDVASGCAYPAAYVLDTLQIVTNNPQAGNAWLSKTQSQDHKYYENQYLSQLCNAFDPQNQVSWFRDAIYVPGGNPDTGYLQAAVPSGLPRQLATTQKVMRIRLRVPVTPPTPCSSGCSRSGTEQMRYMSLSFLGLEGKTLASVADNAFAKDVNGYATLIVGTGALIPTWINAGNGYTYLDLTSNSSYRNLSAISMRNILAAGSFTCGNNVVPFRTAVSSPAGGLMGDYLPVVDYPLAASLPRTASPLVGPNACDVFPNGDPDIIPQCGVQPSPPVQISSANTQCAAPGCNTIAAQAMPPLTIHGAGFGSFPNGLPYQGNSNYLEITDTTQNWDAGYGSDSCTVTIGEWSTTSISLVANVNQSGTCPLAVGDQLTIKVWNPQSMAGPASYNTTVAAN